MAMSPAQFYANIGDRFGATSGRPNPHRGQDYPWGAGTEIPVFTEMLIIAVYYHSGLGNVVVAQTAEGAYIGFCHLLRASEWKPGQVIRAGQIIGLVGNTGTLSAGNHLHMTTSWTSQRPESGAVFDPVPYVSKFIGGNSSIGTPGGGGESGADMPLTEADIFNIWTFQLANGAGVRGRAADWLTNMSDAVAANGKKADSLVVASGRVEGTANRIEAAIKGLTSQGFTDAQVKVVADTIVKAIKIPTAAENGAAARTAIVK